MVCRNAGGKLKKTLLKRFFKICAPPYANISMEKFKKLLITPTLEIFQHFTVDL